MKILKSKTFFRAILQLCILSCITFASSVTSHAAVNNFTEALDDENLVWTTGGAAPWSDLSAETYDGVDAAQSGSLPDLSESWVQTIVDGPGTVTFWWKVSSEEDFDWLKFQIDEFQQEEISGTPAWEQQTFFVAAGSHTLRWRYVKDGGAQSGEDRAWLDNVVFTQASGPPLIISNPIPQIAWQGANVRLSTIAFGDAPLTHEWFFNNELIPIPGATNAVLTLDNISAAQAGFYRLVARNPQGSATSSIAMVTITNNNPVTQVLLFRDNHETDPSPFEIALENLELSYQRFSDPVAFGGKCRKSCEYAGDRRCSGRYFLPHGQHGWLRERRRACSLASSFYV